MDDFYRQLFEGMPCYVTVQDRELKLIAANGLVRRDFDAEHADYCYQLYKGRKEKCPRCPVEKTFADGEVHRSVEVVRQNNGDEIWVSVFTSPMRGPDGEITATIEVSADISDVMLQQQELRALFEEVPCYISVQDRSLRIVEANRRFREDFGDHLGQPCYEVYKHRDEPCLVCPVARTFQDGEPYASEEVVTTQDGRRENVLVRTAPIRDPAGEIVAVMEMSANITELRQVQDRLTSLGLLVGSISHGIKGLLNGLDGGIYLMETGFSKDKLGRVKQGYEMMRRNVDRIRSMVLNVLYYAKDREVSWEPIDLAEITRSAGEVVATRAEQFGVELELDAGSGTFDGDHHAIHAMLVNLAENSIDACRTDKGKTEHRVSLAARVEGQHVIFEVADNGVGMDRETCEKAFSLFFSSKGAEGTGLGLFISNKIVRSHWGEVELDSTPGQGTRMIVRLPLQRPSEQEREAPASGDASDPHGWGEVL